MKLPRFLAVRKAATALASDIRYLRDTVRDEVRYFTVPSLKDLVVAIREDFAEIVKDGRGAFVRGIAKALKVFRVPAVAKAGRRGFLVAMLVVFPALLAYEVAKDVAEAVRSHIGPRAWRGFGSRIAYEWRTA